MAESGRFAGLARPRVTLGSVNWVARTLGFIWVGILAFVIYPPPGGAALVVQATGYGVATLGMLCWTLLDFQPRAARYRSRYLLVVLGIIATAAGWAAPPGMSGGLALIIVAFVAAIAAGSEASVSAALAVTAAGVLATEVSGLAFGVNVGILIGLPLVIVSGLVLGRNRGAYRVQAEQAATLLEQREQLQAEHRRADLLDERARIAREIHDVLAHSLGALSIQIQAARSVLTDRGDIDHASELLSAAQRMAAEGLTETRRAVQALRADTLALNEELANATDTYAQRYRVAATFSSGGDPRPVPPDATIALLRVAQEALVNAAKHAPRRPVTVRLDFQDSGVRLVVRNDLGSPAASPGTQVPDATHDVQTASLGYGLTGMRERLRIINGSLDAGRDNGAWVVTATLPLPSPQENIAS